ncbi:MAG: exodeoxyribonuclease V subunit gamma, partial [Frankiaceae bacterium]|nr:exodeoxyribonuclease V subunit gamma [Arenimonas sp.]
MSTPHPLFLLHHGNDLEMLAGVLAAELARPLPGRALLEPDTVLIPQPAMRRWLQKTLAQTHGIAANLRFLAPGEFVRDALDANVPGAGDEAVGDADVLRWRLWSVLGDARAMAEPVFAPLAPLLQRQDDGVAAWALAGELAQAFEKYQAWRRDWLRRWDKGADADDWQAQLWRRATRGLSHRGRRLDAYLSRFNGTDKHVPVGLPPRVFAFACQNVSPDVLRVIASSARAGTLHFFFLSPVAGWWGDLVTARERLHADADAVFDDSENPLLRANGASGRDFVRTLFSYEVVHPDQDFPLYVAPDPLQRRGLLHDLQRDLLARRPPPVDGALQRPFEEGALADRSLQVHACHTRLREVQVLHDQLRDLLERDPGLQPRDIAVLTPDIDAYAPFVQAVFAGDAGNSPAIPFSLSDGSRLANESVAEALLRLLALPGSRFAVNDVLDLLSVAAIAE